MRINFEMNDIEIRSKLRILPEESDRAIRGAFLFQSARSTAYMKSAAPWTDRTSAARNGLHADTAFGEREYRLILAHAVSYGIWLEVANSGKYQIILPALRAASNELTHLLHNIWGKM